MPREAVGQVELDGLLEAIVAWAAQLLSTPHGYLYLIDPEEKEIEVKVGTGVFDKHVGMRQKPGEGLAGRVWQTCRPIVVDDYDAWPDRSSDFGPGPVRAVVGVPLESGSRVTGVLGVAHTEPGRTFGEDAAELLNQFAQLASIALDNARLYALARRELAEREEAEKALAEKHDLLRALIDSLPDHIYIKDAESRFVLNNAGHVRALGAASPEEIAGKTDFDFYPQELATRYYADEREVIRSGQPLLNKEEPSVDERGNERWHSTTKVPRRDGSGKVVGLVGMTRDITERKEAEEASQRSVARFRAVFDKAAVGMALVNMEGSLMESNPALQRMLGYDGRELRGMHFADVTQRDDVAADAELFEALVAGRLDHFHMEKRYVRKDGSLMWGCLTSSAVRGVESEPWFMIGMVEDITERKEAEGALKESEERYRAVVEQSVESIYLFDPRTKRVLESNLAFQRLVGYAPEELREMTLYDFVAHARDDIDQNVERHLLERGRFVGERRYRRKDGSLMEVEVSATLIPYRGGKAICVVVRDVTERNALEEQLRHRAFHDPLTELPNRALFLDRLGQALARSGRARGSVGVLFVDLDDFKVVNDSLGHEVEDRLLVAVAECLQACIRPGDTVARLFGDEFGVLLEAPTKVDDARRITERVRERLQKPFGVDGREVFVSSSIGIATGDPAPDTAQDRPEGVLRRADLAMYVAKRRGKGRYEIFNPSMNTRALERMELENDLRRAIERGEFEVHYQPIVALETGGIESLEALVRWRHPERGLVAAEEFVQIAEETGLIHPIGRWVFEEACRQAREWRTRHPDKAPLLSVNLSASQFAYQADLIPKVLSDTGLEPGGLIVEITERAVMDEAEFALGKLRRLKDLGVSFAIDDYGTGYSCLRYLKLMPVDSLKIDRSFVAGLGKDPGDEAIVSGTIELAHALGLRVVAEGVESAEQLARLKEFGCDLAQGFYLSKVLPNRAAERLLTGGIPEP